MSTDAAHEGILKALLAGTSRVNALPLEGELATLVDGVGPTGVELRLLRAVAVQAQLQRAGQQPVASPGAPSKPVDPRPAGPTQAGALLREAISLRGERVPLAVCWLRAARASGCRPTSDSIPAMRELADLTRKGDQAWHAAGGEEEPSSEEVAELLAEVGGPTLAWVDRCLTDAAAEDSAALDSLSDAASLTGCERTFKTAGRVAVRAQALGAGRALDPAAARGWLAECLPQEQAKARVELLAELQTRLGPEDEPLLEAALDDRSPAVREVAQSLLVRLPESALVKRNLQRLTSWVTLTADGKLHLSLGELDKSARRDGWQADGKAPDLLDAIGRAPLELAATAIGASLEQLVNSLGPDAMLLGVSILSRKDARGAEALLRMGLQGEVSWKSQSHLIPSLQRVASADALASLDQLLHQRAVTQPRPHLMLLGAWLSGHPGPLQASLAQSWGTWLASQELKASDKEAVSKRAQALRGLGLAMDPASTLEVAEWGQLRTDALLRDATELLLRILDLRRRIRGAFSG